MPSRRMIDPDFWQSETLASLSYEIRLLFIGLFSNADDQGRLRGHPSIIRSLLYPFDDISIERIRAGLNELERVESIVLYEANGKLFIQIVNWWRYQTPQWAYPSNIPAPDGWNDRLRFRKSNKVQQENWDQGGGFRPETVLEEYPPNGREGQEEAEPVREDTLSLREDLPKALPKALPEPIEVVVGLVVEVDKDISDKSPNFSRSLIKKSSVKKTPETIPKKELSPKQLMIMAIAEVCRWDLKIINKKQFGRLGNSARKLNRVRADPPLLAEFGQWWFTHDWRGKKDQPPKPEQIQEEWGNFKTKKGQTNGTNGKNGRENSSEPTEAQVELDRQIADLEAKLAARGIEVPAEFH